MTRDGDRPLVGPKVVVLAEWNAQREKATALRRLFKETPAFLAAIREYKSRKEAAAHMLATRLKEFDTLFDSTIERFSEVEPKMPELDRDRQILRNIGANIKGPEADVVSKYVDDMLDSLDLAWSVRFPGNET